MDPNKNAPGVLDFNRIFDIGGQTRKEGSAERRLRIRDLLRARITTAEPINLEHIGIVFCIDTNKKGYFTQ